MRKMVITLLALGVFAASAAFAGNLVNEAFTYGNGNLVPNNPGAPALGPWATYSGATGDVQIVSNYATGIMATSAFANDDALPFTPQTTATSTYYCVKVLIPCFGATAPVGVYFAGLKDAGTSNMVGRLYVLSQGTTGGWTFGISNSSTNATYGATPWTASLACDTWYTIVVKYDPTTQTSTMWVNPVNEFSPFVTNTMAVNAALAVSTVFLRQGGAATFPSPGFPGTTVWSFRADELGVGTSFAEACYTPPAPTTGACCLRGTTEGACVVVTPEECTIQGGIFLGLGVACDPGVCAVPATKSSWGQVKSIYR